MHEFLKKVRAFAELPDEDLEYLAREVEEVQLSAGEELFAEGSMGDRAYVIKDGQLEILKSSAGREVLLAVRNPGEVIGEMAMVEEEPRMASVRARTATTLLAIHHDQLDRLMSTSAAAARAVSEIVLDRMKSTVAMLRQSEKMAQLGTLTAGVAHELNNPAAAVRRGAEQLQAVITQFGQAHAVLGGSALTGAQRAQLVQMVQQAKDQAARPATLDALARSDREYELETWLEAQGVDEAWQLAPALASLDYDTAKLATLAEAFGPELLPAVVGCLDANYAVYNLLAEIGQGAERISTIVKALKSYSYLDQAPVQAVDIHEGLDDTLVILRNKLPDSIHVRRDYAPDLPKIQGYGSELNQVWTNLIDNAADALDGKGQIVIRTRHQDLWVFVEIEDNGPGIPPEIQSRIFESFFTTKPVGKGTGLGLDISYRIVVQRHRGDLTVSSQPGKTCFQVKLPVNFDAAQGSPPPVAAIQRPSDEQLRDILESTRNIAVVGLSGKRDRAAHTVPAYLQSQGYHIIPVNPTFEAILGEKSYPDLAAIPESVDMVMIFRKSQFVPDIVDQAIKIGAKTVWMQEGIVHDQAADLASAAGLNVVMDACMRETHRRLMAQPST